MAMDLSGIRNINEYYSDHYLGSIFEENARETIASWRARAKEPGEFRAPWSLLKEAGRHCYLLRERAARLKGPGRLAPMARELCDRCLRALGYPAAAPVRAAVTKDLEVPVYLEVTGQRGAPLLWVLLADTEQWGGDVLQGRCFDAAALTEEGPAPGAVLGPDNEELAGRIFFSMDGPPRWLLIAGAGRLALLDRNKWNEKRYLEFDLEEIFGRHEESTLQAVAVLLHRDSVCPAGGGPLLDRLDENSHRHSAAVSRDLRYALREAVELLGGEVLYDMRTRLGRDLEADPVDASELTAECLRYMYRMLFLLFIEARPGLGYAPMKARPYVRGYSLESLRDIADSVRAGLVDEGGVGDGYYLHETLSKLYGLIYEGYPGGEARERLAREESLREIFMLDPLGAHIFDPAFTPMLGAAKLRNRVMLRVIELMSVTRPSGRRGARRGRISYATLGIGQMGAVYEALLSYRGFIAREELYEVKRGKDPFDELGVGYFVPERALPLYAEEERARGPGGSLRRHPKGAFIYRLAGREREKSASYYTPEALTKSLVRYSLEELLEGKSADEILELTVLEPAMGSAAFLNEAINQLAEAYLDRKQRELGRSIPHRDRSGELQHVKMYIADRNVYGIDLNPMAVELAEVSLWLNTIDRGGYVPWFGTQLVCGNSLMGARRECYAKKSLRTTKGPGAWHRAAPERIAPGQRRRPSRVYHFLTGDPGMAAYDDRAIRGLAPEKLGAIRRWRREFTAPYGEDELKTLSGLSRKIDELWARQTVQRRMVKANTSDAIAVFGRETQPPPLPMTVREKDALYKKAYKTENERSAGPYARLKFAMDYWCALWLWPIDKAEELPSRGRFLFDLSMILEGAVDLVYVAGRRAGEMDQTTLYPADREKTELEKLDEEIRGDFGDGVRVDLDDLCKKYRHLAVVRELAERHRFLHWELEFADLFEDRGGFDLILGNPPWVKATWNEQAVLSDRNPLFAVKKYSAARIAALRGELLEDPRARAAYFGEYESVTGTQSFLGAAQNYPALRGQQANLFKCFLPQAWRYGSGNGVSAFIHPDGVYDDPKGGPFREELYPRLRRHYQFYNELRLFAEVHHNTVFSLNVYGSRRAVSFETVANLFDPATLGECYDPSAEGPVPGIKDGENNWNTRGHPGRVLHIGERELRLFAALFDGGAAWKRARLPVLHARELLGVLERFAARERTLSSLREEVASTILWDETQAQISGAIERNVHFPARPLEAIYSGSHIGLANPLFKSSRAVCAQNSDFDNVDLTAVGEGYLQRVNYYPGPDPDSYVARIPELPWGGKYHDEYKLLVRRMLNQSGERTLIAAVAPPGTAHINTLTSIVFRDPCKLAAASALFASLPCDAYVKILGRSDFYFETAEKMPWVEGKLSGALAARGLLLNCVNRYYGELWKRCWREGFREERWAKDDPRLSPGRFSSLSPAWSWGTPLRSDYERRQALVEIDVLAAMALGLTLGQLQSLYRLQFPILRQYEGDTWYDRNGRIAFTNNRSLSGVGLGRAEWSEARGSAEGTFVRVFPDETDPGGPIMRTVEYEAPFDRCDRERDYEIAWRFFSGLFG